MDSLPAGPSLDVVRRQLLAILREAVEGPQEAWSYFTDHGTAAGFLGSLEGHGADEVSWKEADGRTATVAAHVHHSAFGMEASTAFIKGDRTPRDWKQSWRVDRVTAEEWESIQRDFRDRYTTLVRTLEEADLSSDEAFGGAMAAVAHLAYHLGAIRQRLA